MKSREMSKTEDALPAPEPPPSREGGAASEAMPRILRSLGAILLVVAASSFMFRDWGQRDDVVRYLMLLGQLGLLAGAGFFCGLFLDEKRGARTFLSLVVAVVPVHFAVLGGVLYSQLALDAPTSHLAAHAIWRATDATTAVLLILGAQLLIIPATFVAMMTLARRHSAGLTLSFLGLCSVLLVPLREPDAMALVVLVLAPLVLFLQTRVLTGSPSLQTPHGRFARAMLVVPLLVLIGRTFLYYEVTPAFFGVAVGSLGLISFVFDVRADAGRGRYRFAASQLLAIFTMCVGWLSVWADVVRVDILHGSSVGDWPLLTLPAVAIVFAASAFTARGGLVYRRLAALAATLTVVLNLFAFDAIVAGLIALAVGVGLGMYGARVRQKAVIVLGIVAALAGLAHVGILTLRIEALTHWGSLTVFGVVLIFAAAFLDRNRQHLLRRLSAVKGRMRGWSY